MGPSSQYFPIGEDWMTHQDHPPSAKCRHISRRTPERSTEGLLWGSRTPEGDARDLLRESITGEDQPRETGILKKFSRTSSMFSEGTRPTFY